MDTTVIWVSMRENLTLLHVNSNGADQPVYLCSRRPACTIAQSDQLCYSFARLKLKICLFHPPLPAHQNAPYPNNFITIFSCHIFFKFWVAIANPLQTDVKVYLSVFSDARGEEYCMTIKWLLECEDMIIYIIYKIVK